MFRIPGGEKVIANGKRFHSFDGVTFEKDTYLATRSCDMFTSFVNVKNLKRLLSERTCAHQRPAATRNFKCTFHSYATSD